MFSPTRAAIRFGYGLSPHDTPPDSAADLLGGLVAEDHLATTYPVPPLDALMPKMRGFIAARKARSSGEDGAEERFKAARRNIRNEYLRNAATHLARCVDGRASFRERLQVFWSDHFTVRAKAAPYRALPAVFAEYAIRPHIAGSFRDMLRAAATHPAMLLYLDQTRSIGPDSPVGQKRDAGLNENLARELLELHTLGVGAGYSQADVVELAELLTGLSYNNTAGFRYRAAWAQPGAEAVLGQLYGGAEPARLDEIFAALDDIALHPATADHIAHKLAVHFVSDTPDPGLVDAMSTAYRATEGDLLTVYGAMLKHPAAWAPERAKARQPWDFVVASLRAVGVRPDTIMALETPRLRRLILTPLERMGQPYERPPGPDGWPEQAEAWITPSALAERISWAMNLGRLTENRLPDPRSFVDTALGGTASARLSSAAARAASRKSGIGVVLASPEFNRR